MQDLNRCSDPWCGKTLTVAGGESALLQGLCSVRANGASGCSAQRGQSTRRAGGSGVCLSDGPESENADHSVRRFGAWSRQKRLLSGHLWGYFLCRWDPAELEV